MLGLKSVASFLSVVLALSAPDVFADIIRANKLEVKVYYETLCWDSVQFITNQLQPSMAGKGRLAYADLQFVPYGNVVTYEDPRTNKTVLLCQHGRRECELNAQHACIIENTTPQKSFEMITCLMTGYTIVFDKCAEKHGVDLTMAYQCKRTRSVADILKKYGTDTYSLNLSFVPTISIDGVYDYYEQDEILRNFDKIFCNKYKNKFNTTLPQC